MFENASTRAIEVAPIPRRGELTIRVNATVSCGLTSDGQVCDRVLDLGALVELRAADHLIRDLGADERVLEHARLRVGPVEDRDLAAGGAAVEQPIDLAGDVSRLGVLVIELTQADRIALAELAPQTLGAAAAVVGDDGVGGVEDRLRRAVVLLELDDAGVREVLLELEDVADLGTAEAVDRLVGVADDREVAVLAGKQRQPAVLDVVGVLVLVDEDVPEGLDDSARGPPRTAPAR